LEDAYIAYKDGNDAQMANLLGISQQDIEAWGEKSDGEKLDGFFSTIIQSYQSRTIGGDSMRKITGQIVEDTLTNKKTKAADVAKMSILLDNAMKDSGDHALVALNDDYQGLMASLLNVGKLDGGLIPITIGGQDKPYMTLDDWSSYETMWKHVVETLKYNSDARKRNFSYTYNGDETLDREGKAGEYYAENGKLYICIGGQNKNIWKVCTGIKGTNMSKDENKALFNLILRKFSK
jgi:hypothetical protein